MFEQFAALLFAARDFGHRAHLRTDSYAKHMALGDFYSELTDLTDKLVECYQGFNDVVDLPYLDTPVPTTDPLAEIVKFKELVEGTRDEAVGDSRPLQNIVDEVLGVFARTIYKLRQLK